MTVLIGSILLSSKDFILGAFHCIDDGIFLPEISIENNLDCFENKGE